MFHLGPIYQNFNVVSSSDACTGIFIDHVQLLKTPPLICSVCTLQRPEILSKPVV